MKDIRFDEEGLPRCWNCGSKGFTVKRTFRSKATAITAGIATVGIGAGVAALATKKKMQCQRCGKYNQTGNGQPWTGPADRKFRKEYQAELERREQERSR